MKPVDCGWVASVVLQGVIRAYQLMISPVLTPSCRYLPTCSDYAIEAVARHGVLRGTAFAVRRLARCHPWGGSGYDPVPFPLSAKPAATLGSRPDCPHP